MSVMRQRLRRFWFALWGVAAVIVILIALLFSVLRLVLPYAADYKETIEVRASALLKHPVKIARIEPNWRWLTPRLRLLNVQVGDEQSAMPHLKLREIVVGLDLLGSIIAFATRIASIDVVGADIIVERNSEDAIWVQGVRVPIRRQHDAKAFILPEFFNGKTLRLLDSHVVLRNYDAEYVLDGLNVSLAKSGNQHQVFLVSRLPHVFGQKLELGLDFFWDAGGVENLRGNGYVRGKNVNLTKIQQFYPQFDRLRSGYADFELWLDVRSKQVESVKGRLQLSKVLLQSADAATRWSLDLFEAKILLLRQRNGALLLLEDMRLQDQRRLSQTSDVMASIVTNAEQHIESVQLYTDYLRMDDFLPAVKMLPGMSEKVYTLMSRYGAQGSLSDLTLRWEASREARAAQLMLITEFDDLGVQGQEWVPSVAGLRGQVFVNSNGTGKATVSGQGLDVDYPRLFREHIPISQLSANLRFAKKPDGFLLQSDDLVLNVPHLKTRSHIRLLAVPGVKPYLELRGQLDAGDMAYTSHYLPVGVMSGNSVRWLDNSIRGGRLDNGQYEIKGWMDGFPFRDKPGVFRVEADFSSAELLFSQKWPVVRNISGRLKFDGPGLFIDGYYANVFSADLADMGMVIPDLKASVMDLDLKAFASMQDSLRFIRESPLRKTFAAIVDDVTAEGTQSTAISLHIPLHNKTAHEFSHRGQMDIYGGRLFFPKWGLDFSGIENQVVYADQQVSMPRKPVRFNDRSVDMEVLTRPLEGRASMQIRLAGMLSLQNILKKQKPFWLGQVRGSADFESVLRVPFKKSENDPMRPSMQVRTNLVGVTSNLPVPFFKKSEMAEHTVIESRFLPESQIEVDAVFSDWLHGKVLLDSSSGEIQLKKSDVRLSNGLARLGPFEGITVSGRLDRFDYDEWQKLLAANPKRDGGVLDLLKEVRLDVGRLTYLGYHVQPVTLEIVPADAFWRFDVDSAAVKGRIEVPRDVSSGLPLNVQLQALDLNVLRQDYVQGEPGDPAKLPPIRFTADKVVLNDWRLQQVGLSSTPLPSGLKINSLTVRDPDLQLRGDGEWLVKADGHQQTHLHINIESKNAGAGLGKLGYAKFIQDGHGTSEFDIAWEASPAEFNFAGLKGNARMAFKEGQILEWDPGAGGRIFGLISLQTIPRRLALDFKDLTGKGLRFDKLRGDFTFADGNAYTSNFYIDGPVGRIDIQGRTGLVACDYEQTVTFLPDLSSSLPIIGALLGGASGGLSVIVVDRIARLFGKQVDHLGRVKYSVSGSWDAPIIESLKEVKKQNGKKQSTRHQ